MAPGPASCAARQAPNSQPEPMIDPSPVNISATAPTSRRMAFSLDIPEFSRLMVARSCRSRAAGTSSQHTTIIGRRVLELVEIAGQGGAHRIRQGSYRMPVVVMIDSDA